MIFRYVILASISIMSVAAGSSYQFVRFQNGNSPSKSGKSAYLRSSGGYSNFSPDKPFSKGHFDSFENFLSNPEFFPPSSVIDLTHLPEELLSLSEEINEVHDPYLLTGDAAYAAARHLYRKELFLGQFPHVRALLNNQEKRRLNGLAGNRLGSLRPDSPFHRYGSARRWSWYL